MGNTHTQIHTHEHTQTHTNTLTQTHTNKHTHTHTQTHTISYSHSDFFQLGCLGLTGSTELQRNHSGAFSMVRLGLS